MGSPIHHLSKSLNIQNIKEKIVQDLKDKLQKEKEEEMYDLREKFNNMDKRVC
jgi:hypothetical protein